MEDLIKIINSKDEKIKKLNDKIKKEKDNNEINKLLNEKNEIINEKIQLTNIIFKINPNNQVNNKIINDNTERKKPIKRKNPLMPGEEEKSVEEDFGYLKDPHGNRYIKSKKKFNSSFNNTEEKNQIKKENSVTEENKIKNENKI